MKTCKVSDLFDVQYGNSLELIYLEKDIKGINFISRTAKRNGVSDKVKPIPTEKPFPAGVLTVAVGGSSRLRGLKERIFDETDIPIQISDDPMTVVAKGTAIVAAEPLALEPEVRLKAMK